MYVIYVVFVNGKIKLNVLKCSCLFSLMSTHVRNIIIALTILPKSYLICFVNITAQGDATVSCYLEQWNNFVLYSIITNNTNDHLCAINLTGAFFPFSTWCLLMLYYQNFCCSYKSTFINYSKCSSFTFLWILV